MQPTARRTLVVAEASAERSATDSSRKQWAAAFFGPFSLGAFGLLGRPPHFCGESPVAQGVPMPPSRSSLTSEGSLHTMRVDTLNPSVYVATLRRIHMEMSFRGFL